jgi:hypothetical protein
MSSDPRNLRNIPEQVLQIARAIARHSGLSESDILRLALASGILVEICKITPDRSGTYGGLQADYLAKALRRHLSSAIDFLLEQGQHPYQAAFTTGGSGATLTQTVASAAASTPETPIDTAMADELEGLGIGLGLGLSSDMEVPVGIS